MPGTVVVATLMYSCYVLTSQYANAFAGASHNHDGLLPSGAMVLGYTQNDTTLGVGGVMVVGTGKQGHRVVRITTIGGKLIPLLWKISSNKDQNPGILVILEA